MDEVSRSIDLATDKVIQEVIRRKFRSYDYFKPTF